MQPSKEKATDSIGKAEQWLKEAEMILNAGAYDSCIAASYLAIFHAARAILFRDGIRKKAIIVLHDI